MARLIVVEGPDNSGKSTFIQHLLNNFPGTELIQFPKRNTDKSRFNIITRNDLAIFETMLDYLPQDKVFVLDRSYISNAVYERLRGDSKWPMYTSDMIDLIDHHDVLVVPLTRNYLDVPFQDDLISLSAEGFNKVIDLYNDEYEGLGLKPIEILKMDNENNPIESMALIDIDDALGLSEFIYA